MGKTTFGTPYFQSLQAARAYYKPYGYDDINEAVKMKLDNGEIHIGKPPKKKDTDRIYLNPEERRYFIETED